MRFKDVGALLLLAALWGGSFLFIRIAVPALGPILLVELRVVIAGLALMLFAVASRSLPNLRAGWWKYLILGALNGAIPYTLVAAAEIHLTASLAVSLNATVPLCTAVISAIWLKDRIGAQKAGGIALGMVGVVVLVGWSSPPLTPTVVFSLCAALGAALSYGLVNVFSKVAFVGSAPLTLAIGQQIGAGVLLLPLALPAAAKLAPTIQPTPWLICTVLALALLSTSLAYLLFFHLLIHTGPMGAASVTFLTPVTGIAGGAIFLHEPVGAGTFVGAGIILFSVALVTGMGRRPVTRSQRASLSGNSSASK